MELRRARCASRRRVSCASSDRGGSASGAAGFTLVEVVIAMGVFMVGMVALAQLLAVSVQMHQVSRNTDLATQLAQQKIEELMKLNFDTAAVVQPTPNGVDALNSNATNYFDVPAGSRYTRRWRVEAGPVARTRRVTVRLVPFEAGRLTARQVELTTIIRQW